MAAFRLAATIPLLAHPHCNRWLFCSLNTHKPHEKPFLPNGRSPLQEGLPGGIWSGAEKEKESDSNQIRLQSERSQSVTTSIHS